MTDQTLEHLTTEHTVEHPTSRTYWIIALVLGVITAIEVAVGYMGLPGAVAIPALIIAGLLKFGIVVAFFMHLRYDKPLYRSLFLVGAIGVVPIFLVILATFNAL